MKEIENVFISMAKLAAVSIYAYKAKKEFDKACADLKKLEKKERKERRRIWWNKIFKKLKNMKKLRLLIVIAILALMVWCSSEAQTGESGTAIQYECYDYYKEFAKDFLYLLSEYENWYKSQHGNEIKLCWHDGYGEPIIEGMDTTICESITVTTLEIKTPYADETAFQGFIWWLKNEFIE